MAPCVEMPSKESYRVLVIPSAAAFLFILEMNDTVRFAVVVPLPKVSARAIAASQPDGSSMPYSSCLTVSLSPFCRSAALPPLVLM